MQNLYILTLTVLCTVCLSSVLARSVHENTRWRRSPTVDQRLSEIQALLALGHGGDVGHGLFDPDLIGKRKRGGSPAEDISEVNDLSDTQRMQLLKSMMQLLEDYQA